MATKADRDDDRKHEHDEADEDEREDKDSEEEDESEEEATDADKGKAAKSSSAKKASDADEPAEDEEDEDKHEEEDGEEDAEASPAPKPSRRVRARGPGAARLRRGSGVAPTGSLGKSVLLFFVIVIGLGAGFMILGREVPQEVAKPKWSVGQTVDIELTLVKTDRVELSCASGEEVAGKHCAFESTNKPWSKGGDPNDDKTVLKPYTTTDRMQFTATGVWSEPALQPDKVPAARFSVKCKYKVEGNLKNLNVRWDTAQQWYPQENWYAGTVSNCTVNQ